MNVWVDSWAVGVSQAWLWPVPCELFPHTGLLKSAPCGGWKTTTSPTLGWVDSRLVSTRWPGSSVGTIEELGIR